MGTTVLFSAARMQAIEDGTITAGLIDVNGHLLLTRHDGTQVDAGQTKGDKGDKGDNGSIGVDGKTGIPLGAIMAWGGDAAAPIPANALELNGQSVLAATYSGLAALYPSWVVGANLVLPDLRTRTISGYKAGDATFGTLGAFLGAPTVQPPSHRHTFAYGVLDNGTFGSGGTNAGLGAPGSAGAFKYSTGAYAGGVADGTQVETTAAGGSQTNAAKNRYKSVGDTDVASTNPALSIIQPTYVGRWIVIAADNSGSYSPTVQSALVGRVTAVEAALGPRGTIVGALSGGQVSVLLSDGVTTVTAKFQVDAGMLTSNQVTLTRYFDGTYGITGNQAPANGGFISEPYDYINPKIGWYQSIVNDYTYYSTPIQYRSPNCWVALTGMMRTTAAIAAGEVLVTLSPAFRPLQSKLVSALFNGNSYLVLKIATNGQVTLFQGAIAAANWFALDGIQFNNNPSLVRTPMVLTNGFAVYSATDFTPQYCADDGSGRIFVEGVVKQAGNVGGSGSPLALTSANPGLAEGGIYGTLHRVASITAGWKRVNLGYSSSGTNLSQEAATADAGVSLEIFMPTAAKYATWSGMVYQGASNRDYGSNWRPVREGLYGDGMYGLTGLAAISTGGVIGSVHGAYAPKFNILQQPEAAGVGNGRMDILGSFNSPASGGTVNFVTGSGSYVGFEEYSWVPQQLDSALHR